jgi:hypothetical protein
LEALATVNLALHNAPSYSRSGYGSTATASTETISSGQLSWDSLELVASANVRFGSRLRVF